MVSRVEHKGRGTIIIARVEDRSTVSQVKGGSGVLEVPQRFFCRSVS